jgi:glutathione S-transferase
MSLIFYTNPMSRGRIVRWMIEEIGEPYDTKLINYGPEMKGPDYRAINPMGKVPAIVHDGAVVTEAAAIVAYLADAFPAAGLVPPAGTAAKAAYYRWLFYAAGPIESAVTNRSLGVEIPADKKGFVGYGCFEEVMDAMERAVSASPYIAGDAFTAADVYFGSQIGFGLAFGSIDKRPAFEDYWARIGGRPAKQRADAADDALMAEIEQG